MLQLRLADADRERLGCPELLPVVTAMTITNREAVELQRLGYPTPQAFGAALNRDGDDIDINAWTALVWLALRRVGIETDAKTLEFSLLGLRLINDDDEAPKVAVAGKAPGRGRSTNSRKTRSTPGATSAAKSTRTGSRS